MPATKSSYTCAKSVTKCCHLIISKWAANATCATCISRKSTRSTLWELWTSANDKDLGHFDQKQLKMSRQDVVALMTKDQQPRFLQWCIVPHNSLQQLAPNNAARSSHQRHYLNCNGNLRVVLALQGYQRDLSQLL